MSVKVFIKRMCPHDREGELRQCLRPLRQVVPEQPGYICGEYLKSLDHPGEIMTISTWMSEDDWRIWYESDTRLRLQSRIDMIPGVTTEYSVFEHFSTT